MTDDTRYRTDQNKYFSWRNPLHLHFLQSSIRLLLPSPQFRAELQMMASVVLYRFRTNIGKTASLLKIESLSRRFKYTAKSRRGLGEKMESIKDITTHEYPDISPEFQPGRDLRKRAAENLR